MAPVWKNRRVWVIFILFLAFRFLFSFRLPVFNDEAIYLRLGLGLRLDPGYWWAYAFDGKQPLVIVMTALAQLVPTDPLFAARAISILWSSVAFWTAAAIIRRFFHKSDITLTLILCAACPFLILYDTLTLAESPINACFMLLLYLTLLFSERPSLRTGLYMGLVFGLGWWFKTTIFLSIPLILTTLLFSPAIRHNRKSAGIGLLLAVISAFIIIAPLRFNVQLHYEDMQAVGRFNTVSGIVRLPFGSFIASAFQMAGWVVVYTGLFVIACSAIALWHNRKDRIVWMVFLWAILPVVMELIIMTSFTSRYIFMTVIPWILLAGAGIVSLRPALQKVVVAVSVMTGVFFASSPLAFYRLLAPVPAVQRDFSQYVVGWTSGYGIREAMQTLTEIAKFKKIAVFVILHNGNPEDAIPPYLAPYDIPVLQLYQIASAAKIPAMTSRSWYFVSRGLQYGGLEPYLTEVARFKKPLDDEFVGVYEIRLKVVP